MEHFWQRVEFTSAWQDLHTNVCHTQATVTALLNFLYKRMALHLVYTLTVFVKYCEGSPTKRAFEFGFAIRK